MPTNSGSTKSSRKVSKKAGKKVAKKAARKVATKVPKKAARKKVIDVSAEQRHEMIAKAAYYRANRRHFQGGDPVADWLYSEKEIDALLSKTGA
ncbi:MAG: DUF2934 domain-containing protein [Gammaproteobacteria bacterium]|nr:DUF2934 domain-containing protein [Gammaproteobacteria bacterium]NNL43928.1 DUF2934 domain-containing protein [Woeseiaceae bacterium]